MCRRELFLTGDKLESGMHVGPIFPYAATNMFAVKVTCDGVTRQVFQAGFHPP